MHGQVCACPLWIIVKRLRAVVTRVTVSRKGLALGSDTGRGDDVIKSIGVPAFSALAVLGVAPAVAAASPAEATVVQIAAGSVSCDAAVENPHFSRGAGSVIFKTRIRCRGTGQVPPAVQVRIQGSLGSINGAPPPAPAPQGPPLQRATSDQTQNVAVNGGEATFYTPVAGGPKVTGSSWYEGNIYGQIVGPPGGVYPPPSRARSNRVWVNA